MAWEGRRRGGQEGGDILRHVSKIRISFVCMGNICRSPTAEGVFRNLVEQAGLSNRFEIESHGIGPWHIGEAPDPRAQQTARAHGLRLDCVAQQIRARDFGRFDHLVALDRDVAEQLRRLAPTPADRARVRLLREFDPQARGDLDVPDPYYGGPSGFEDAFAMIERSAKGVLQWLASTAEADGGHAT
jgi:protein-tyrosine phosphatase